MDTYEELRDRIGRLRQQIEAFMIRVNDNESVSRDLSTVIESATRMEDNLSVLIGMPKDAQLMSLSYGIGRSLRTASNTLYGFLRVQQEPRFSNLSPEDITFLTPFLDEVKDICEQIRTHDDVAIRAFNDLALITTQVIHPAAFFTIFAPFFDYAIDKAQLIQHSPPTSTDRCVVHHPQWTLYLLANMLGFLARAYQRQHQAWGAVAMSFHQDDYFAHLRLTAPLLVTPMLWGELLQTSISYGYESLREIGGDIEPLTWDEGQGQGVIVKLPWAVSPHKP